MGVGVKILLKFMLIAIRWHRRIERLEVGLLSDFRELPPRGSRMPAFSVKTLASLHGEGVCIMTKFMLKGGDSTRSS